MLIARLVGESDDYVVERRFDSEGQAITWITGAGLSEFDDQTARGEILDGAKIIWTKSSLQNSDSRQREARRNAVRFLAKLNIPIKR